MSSSKSVYYSESERLPSLEALKKMIEEGDSSLMEPHIATYIEQLNVVRGLYDRYEGKKAIIKTLMLMWPKLKQSGATQVYCDALNFFNSDNSVTKDAWRNIYANQLDEAALLALHKDDFASFARLKEQAAKLRKLYDEDKKGNDDERRAQIVVYDIKPEQLGMEPANRKELAAILDNFCLPKDEEDRLKSEAGIKPFKLYSDEEKKAD